MAKGKCCMWEELFKEISRGIEKNQTSIFSKMGGVILSQSSPLDYLCVSQVYPLLLYMVIIY